MLVGLYEEHLYESSGLSEELSQVEMLLERNKLKEAGRKLTKIGLIFLTVPEPW